MRYKAYLLLCCSCVCMAQTSKMLRARYGEPDVERFIARPNITATIEYGNDGSTCQIVIEAQKPLVRLDQSVKHIKREEVSAIIEELVPHSSWGREVFKFNEEMGCARGETIEYENVVVSRNWDQCTSSPERESTATVTFKRNSCPPALILSKQPRSEQPHHTP